MTKLITVLIVIIVLFIGWHLFQYWETVKNEEEAKQKQEQATQIVPEQLPGMPDKLQQKLEESLRAAQKEGASGLRTWLKNYGASVQDPRKAWIELDYCEYLSREDIPEAKRIFAGVKARTSKASPVWKRIEQMQKTYE